MDKYHCNVSLILLLLLLEIDNIILLVTMGSLIEFVFAYYY